MAPVQTAFDFGSDYASQSGADITNNGGAAARYPALTFTVDDVPSAARRRVLRYRCGAPRSIAAALSLIVRSAIRTLTSDRPAGPRPPQCAITDPPAPPVTQHAPAGSDQALPEPSINVEGADPNPRFNISERDFVEFLAALRHSFVGMPKQWTNFLDIAGRFLSGEPYPVPAS